MCQLVSILFFLVLMEPLAQASSKTLFLDYFEGFLPKHHTLRVKVRWLTQSAKRVSTTYRTVKPLPSERADYRRRETQIARRFELGSVPEGATFVNVSVYDRGLKTDREIRAVGFSTSHDLNEEIHFRREGEKGAKLEFSFRHKNTDNAPILKPISSRPKLYLDHFEGYLPKGGRLEVEIRWRMPPSGEGFIQEGWVYTFAKKHRLDEETARLPRHYFMKKVPKRARYLDLAFYARTETERVLVGEFKNLDVYILRRQRARVYEINRETGFAANIRVSIRKNWNSGTSVEAEERVTQVKHRSFERADPLDRLILFIGADVYEQGKIGLDRIEKAIEEGVEFKSPLGTILQKEHVEIARQVLNDLFYETLRELDLFDGSLFRQSHEYRRHMSVSFFLRDSSGKRIASHTELKYSPHLSTHFSVESYFKAENDEKRQSIVVHRVLSDPPINFEYPDFTPASDFLASSTPEPPSNSRVKALKRGNSLWDRAIEYLIDPERNSQISQATPPVQSLHSKEARETAKGPLAFLQHRDFENLRITVEDRLRGEKAPTRKVLAELNAEEFFKLNPPEHHHSLTLLELYGETGGRIPYFPNVQTLLYVPTHASSMYQLEDLTASAPPFFRLGANRSKITYRLPQYISTSETQDHVGKEKTVCGRISDLGGRPVSYIRLVQHDPDNGFTFYGRHMNIDLRTRGANNLLGKIACATGLIEDQTRDPNVRWTSGAFMKLKRVGEVLFF